MPTEQEVLDVLKQVEDPDLRRDIVSLGFVRNLSIENGAVRFDINLTTPACPVKDQMQEAAKRLVATLPGVTAVEARMTADVRRSVTPNTDAIKGIKNIIAIASGKGGVGKSTVAVNLAVAMAQTGARVGLLDADIYGPTIPLIMGPEAQIDITDKNEIIPAEAHGVKFVSMGFMAPGDKPLIWRGPMAHQALQQTLFQSRWAELDYLFVDLPPGTGDVHLTLVQSSQVTGGVLVTTPQDIGLTISLKTFRMFQSTNVRMLGVIENMSYRVCPSCGHKDELFGRGGAAEVSQHLNVPFLGSIPLDPKIAILADHGRPVVAVEPNSDIGVIYKDLVKKLAAQVSIASFERPEVAVVEE